MIFGSHLILFSADPEADRRFLSDALSLPSVDAGDGWLIFSLPPSEAAVHPSDSPSISLYLMCDELEPHLSSLTAAGATCSPISAAPWGDVATLTLPSGTEIGLYTPRHRTAIGDDTGA